MSDAYGRLPLHFEERQGPGGTHTRYLARTEGGAVSLSPDGLALELDGHAIRFTFAAPRTRARLAPLEPLPGRVNYYIGPDPSRWRTGITTYRRVRYDAIHPGIDVVVYGNQRQVEYDFVVAPGADPSALRVRIDGADAVTLGAAGDITIRRGSRTIVQHAPVAYQERDGRREPVTARYVLRHGRDVVFEVGAYDRARPLIIDPLIAYSARIGLGTARAIAVDSAGYAYFTGENVGAFNGEYPLVNAAFTQRTGQSEIFVTKLSPNGDTLIYSTYIGSANPDFVHGIATDGSGNAYITGLGHSGYPTTSGAFQTTTMGGGEDSSVTVVSKFGPSGALVYSTFLQGTTFDNPSDPIRGGVCYQGSGNGIAADAAGNTYVVGFTSTNDFPTTPGAYIPTKPTVGTRCNTYPGGYLTKLSPNGASLVYSTYLDGNGAGLSIAVDAAGNAYVGGTAAPPSAPPGTVKASLAASGATTGPYVARFDSAGSPTQTTTIGAFPESLSLGPDGSVYVAGGNPSDFKPVNAFQPTASGADGFAARMTSDGTAWMWATYIGGSGTDAMTSIAADEDGSAWVVGYTSSSDFPFKSAVRDKTQSTEALALKLSATGDHVFSTPLGDGHASGVALDAASNVYVTGDAGATFTPTSPGAYSKPATGGGAHDVFVLKFLADHTAPTVTLTRPNDGDWTGNSINVAPLANDNVALAKVELWGNGSIFYTMACSGIAASCGGTIWWTTGSLPRGAYEINAVAFDTWGNRTVSPTVTIYKDARTPVYPSGASGNSGGGGNGGGGGGGDTTPPTATITSPGNGAWTGNSIRVTATANDNVGLASLKVYGNGGVVLQRTCSATSCTLDDWWTTGSLATGAYEIQAVATDTAGNCATSAPVTINKDATAPVKPSGAPTCSSSGGGGGGGGDTAPPSVAIATPSDGAWTGNSIHVIANASDGVGLATLKLFGDGVQFGETNCTGATTCTWNDWWPTASLSSGQHTITAVSTDTAGNTTTSSPLTINK